MTQAAHTIRDVPSRMDSAIFRGKATLLQLRRGVANRLDPAVKKHPRSPTLAGARPIAASVTPLWTETDPRERFLVAGKIQNLRLAISQLDGVKVSAGQIFSFWKQIGRTRTATGYVSGREIRQGCLIPTVGGGLCQLSNALYDAALKANFEIVERHAHSQVIAGSLAEVGRDATVFWNYIDLRFRSAIDFRIEAKMDAENLTITFHAGEIVNQFHKIERTARNASTVNSCASCGEVSCHKMVTSASTEFGRTAYLLDEYWPEFQAYINGHRKENDRILIPLDGKFFRKGNYAWDTKGFGNVDQSLLTTLVRSYRSRKLSQQGAARQMNLLAMQERLAESYARKLRADDLHLVIQQDLLKYLWRDGHLGGRTFDVLMTALPISELQSRLDLAAELHPESTTLGDFRADQELAFAEASALKHARSIITPHSAIASIFPDRAVLLDWKMPAISSAKRKQNERPVIVFPASTVGRKGCYELRDAVRGLDAKIMLMGPIIEDKDFWNGFDVEPAGPEAIASASVLVLPAFVEHRPRRLLMAAARKIPVVASEACGVSNVEGITIIPAGDVDRLRSALIESLESVSL